MLKRLRNLEGFRLVLEPDMTRVERIVVVMVVVVEKTKGSLMMHPWWRMVFGCFLLPTMVM